MRYKFIGIPFLLFIFYTGFQLCFSVQFIETIKTLLDSSSYDSQSDEITATVSEKLAETNRNILDSLPYKTQMVEFNGSLLKAFGARSFYNTQYNLNITTDGYNINLYDETTTDYEIQEMIDFKNYLDSKGIHLLYVNEPAKYTDDTLCLKQFGKESYLNHNADLFLSRLSEADIDCLDLRETIKTENLNPMDLFYRTDHHWTVPASKWAAEKVSEALNQKCGYSIDLNLYNPERFQETYYQNAWLGEQGRKVSESYIGLDDYVMIEPLYDTSYTVFNAKGNAVQEGSFEIFIDKNTYAIDDVYFGPSWHYSYQPYKNKVIHNNLANYGSILILGDSYEASMAPFLSLGIKDLQLVILRDMEGSVRELIETGNYDTVIIAYAQFMIGAHDDTSNANYRMFTFD